MSQGTSQSVDAALLWKMNFDDSFDLPFHSLIAAFGIEAVMALDELVLEQTRQAAIGAVKFHRDRLLAAGASGEAIQEKSQSLAQNIAKALKNTRVTVSHEPLLPEQAVFNVAPVRPSP